MSLMYGIDIYNSIIIQVKFENKKLMKTTVF